MGETVGQHAYGTSLMCINRRAYILGFCLVMSFVCLAQIGKWFLSMSLFNSLTGVEYLPPKACMGLECYEVFTCRGFAWTTDSIRNPLSTLSGAILFPLGVVAALHGYRTELRIVAFYLSLLTATYIACFFADVIYYESCNAYPADAIEQALLWPIPFPLRRTAQEQIAKMRFFPKDDVDKITNGFATMAMYLVIQFVVCVVLIYTSRQAQLLGMLFERGPIGLGVHYGLGQFDEIINHEEIRRRKEPKSFFVEDGQLPTYQNDAEAPLAYHVGHNYGAFHGQSARLAKGPSTDVDHWKERQQQVQQEMASAENDLATAEKAFNEAREVASHEKDVEMKEEYEAMEKFRHHEIHKEFHQEHRAEHLAHYAAEEAAQQAEEAGLSPQETRMAMMSAYQHKLSGHHRTMLEMTKARTLHEHYRHAEREQHYHEMEGEAAKNLRESESEVIDAQRRMQNAQDAKRSLDAEGRGLMQQNLWQDPEADAFLQEPKTLAPGASLDPMMTSGTFGGTANFGSAVPSNLA